MRGSPERLRQQVGIGRVKSARLDATGNPGLQRLVCGSRAGCPFGFVRVQKKRESIVIRIFEPKPAVGVHPAFQHGNRVFDRPCDDRGRRFYEGLKALLRETGEYLLFIPEVPIYSRRRIADLLGEAAQRKALITLMDKAGACRREDERPDFRFVSRAPLNGIHVNTDHNSEHRSLVSSEHSAARNSERFRIHFGMKSRFQAMGVLRIRGMDGSRVHGPVDPTESPCGGRPL